MLDFGLAKLAEAAGDSDANEPTAVKTADGLIVGTANYMSPEQALGEDVDHRSDIFSSGIVFYEMLTGRRPFDGNTSTRIIDNIVHTEPAAIDAAGDVTLGELARIVAKCLQKDRERRYQSARELRVDLENLRSGSRSATQATARVNASPRGLRTAAIAIAAIVAALALYTALHRGDDAAVDGRRPKTEKTIAVLPFRNLSANPENAFFTDGVHEDVMMKLASLRELQVVSRTSVMRFAKHDSDLRAIGRRLGARYIVEGSVRREGNQVRVTATLVDTTTDRTLWSSSYDRELVNIFALQSAIAQEIATTLQATISPDEKRRLDAIPTVVVAANDDYLRARGILNASRYDFDELKNAISLLESATAADPSFARAWALLALAHSDHFERLGELDDREADATSAAEAARSALERARGLDPEGLATLRAAGYFHETVEDNVVEAMRNLDRALAVEPADSETLLFQARILMRLGKIDGVVTNLEKAYEVDKANGSIIYGLTLAYEATRQYAKMAPFFDRLLRLEPEKTHYGVQAKYYQFLADGSLASFEALESAVKNIEKTDRCDLRTVQNREMVVALASGDFETYAKNWQGKWDRHTLGHGNWACPGRLNDEANHAHLLLERGKTDIAKAIIARAQNESTRPYTEMSMCIFDRNAFKPKLDYMSGDTELARRELDEAIVTILRNEAFPRGPVERAVLLESVDMVAPDRVYSLYKEIVSDPVSLISMEVICANPWTYPNLLKDPRFVAEVRKDRRFVGFLEKYGWL